MNGSPNNGMQPTPQSGAADAERSAVKVKAPLMLGVLDADRVAGAVAPITCSGGAIGRPRRS